MVAAAKSRCLALVVLVVCFLSPELHAQSSPDLVISSFTMSPAIATTADQITFTAVVKNQGTALASFSWMGLQVGGGLATYILPELAPGDTTTITRTVGPLIQITYQATATADYYGDVTESDESNNVSKLIFSVYAPGPPDLVISSLSVSPSSPTSNDTLTLTAVVKNQGAGPAQSSSSMTLQVGNEPNPPSYNVPALAPGATTTITRTVSPLAVQAYVATATADSGGDIAESNEANNVTTLNFSVIVPLVPDLVISSFSVSPSNPTTADTLTFTAVVKNQGTGAASSSSMTLQVSGDPTPPSFTVPALAPGATTTITRTVPPLAAQLYVATAKADSGAAIAESNEGNNSSVLIFTVVANGPVDLVISSFSVSPSNPTTADSATLTAVVKNQGTGAASPSSMTIRFGGEFPGQSYAVPALASGAMTTITRTVGTLPPFYFLSEATADSGGNIAESDESNNATTLEFLVVQAYPDLVISSFSVSPSSPTPADTLTFTAVVKNQGTSSASSSSMTLQVGNEPNPPSYAVSALAVGATTTITRTLGPLTAQTYLATATADSGGDNAESNEANNVTTLSFAVATPTARRRPQLTSQ